jgi:hypothetical protein
MKPKKMLANRIITPDGTMLQSFSRHNFVKYTDDNGKEYAVDGGLDYQRTFWHEDAPHTDACVYNTDPHELIRQAFCWGSYGKDGKQPIQWKPVETMTDEHIKAILETQHHISDHIRGVFEKEQEFRHDHNITIKDAE